jgi:hypothetical protein
VSLAHCSYCGQRNSAKYSQVTWAWKRADNTRAAWRQTLCAGCFAQLVLRVDKPDATEGTLTCPACGIDTEHDYDAIYITAFLPGYGKMTYEWPTCGACAVPIRAEAMVNAQLLEDRPVQGPTAAPAQDPSLSAWADLGIVPRE